MKAQGNLSKNVVITIFIIVIALLLLFFGYKWFGKKEAVLPIKKVTAEKMKPTGKVLISWQEGQTKEIPVITTDSLQEEKNKLFKTNPQLKTMMAFMDEKELDRNLSEGLMNQSIVDRYIEENNINQNSDYQTELQEGYKAVERMINTKFFSQLFPAQVTDAEVKSFYDKNKDMVPDLLVSRGGVEARGIMFDNEKLANEFLSTVKEEKNFQQALQKAGLANKEKDFKLVNEQSVGIETPLRDKIVNMKKVPSTELVKVDDKFWVVYASKKEDSKYRPLDQVKNNIKQFLEKEKRSEKFEEEMSKLKKEYNVVINEDYFKTEKPAEITAEQQKESRITTNPVIQKKVADNKIESDKKNRQEKQVAALHTQVV